MSKSIHSTCSKLVLGWLLLVAQCVAQPSPPTSAICSSSNTSFEYEAQAGDNVIIYWTPDVVTGAIAFQVVYGGQGYISIGFSADSFMVGSDAVVAVPGDNSSVLEYDLISKASGGQEVYDTQEITSTSVSQDDSTTTMEFTRPFEPSDSSKEVLSTVSGELTYIIWAYGDSNVFQIHEGSGSIQLDLFCEDGSTAEDGSPSPTPASASATESPSPVVTTVPPSTSAPSVSVTTVGATEFPSPVATTVLPSTSAPSVSVTTVGATESPSPVATMLPVGSSSPTGAPTDGQASTMEPTAETSGGSKLEAGGWIVFLKAGIVAFLTSRVLAR